MAKPHYDTAKPAPVEWDEPMNCARCLDLNCDWGDAGEVAGKAGACWNCFELEPCCGSPCSVPEGAVCCLCWYCCASCSTSKLLAHSLDQQFNWINHCCLPICVMSLISAVAFGGIVGGSIVFALIGIPSLTVVTYPLILIPMVMALFYRALIRRNIRVKYQVGSKHSWLGDVLMTCCSCTAPCSLCQELRAVPADGWNWLADMQKNGFHLVDTQTLGRLIR